MVENYRIIKHAVCEICPRLKNPGSSTETFLQDQIDMLKMMEIRYREKEYNPKIAWNYFADTIADKLNILEINAAGFWMIPCELDQAVKLYKTVLEPYQVREILGI